MHTVKKFSSSLIFLSGGGEMGDLIRTRDWSGNILGEPLYWPQNLQTAVSICLNSRLPMVIWWGKDLIKIYNDAYSKIIGAKHPHALGSKGKDVWPEIWPVVGPVLQTVLQTGEATFREDQFLINERNGYAEEYYFTFSYSAVRDDARKVAGVFCAVNETTKKVISERNFSNKLNTLFKHVPVAICILRGKNHTVEMVNEKMLQFMGRKKDEVVNMPVFDAMPEVKEQIFKELLDKVYSTGERFVADELPVNLMRNGKLENAYVKFAYEPLRNEDGIVSGIMAVAHEITDEVYNRNKNEKNDAFNRTVLESSPDCLKVIDGEGKIQFTNHNGLCLLEVDDFNMIKNTPWWQMWGEQNQQMVKEAVAKSLGGETAYFQAVDFTLKGTKKWWDVIVSPVLEEDVHKKVSYIIAVSRDITKQKKEEIKLAESEQRFRNLVEKSPSPILILKGKEMLLEVLNQPVLSIFNITAGSLGKPLLQVLPEFKGQPFIEWLMDVYQNGVTHYGNEMPAYFKRVNGQIETLYFNFVYQPYREDDGNISGVMITASDVTEQVVARKKVEVQTRLFEDMLITAPGFVCTLSGPAHVYELVNAQYQNLFGKRHLQGKPIMIALPELEGQGFDTLLDHVYNTGETYVGIDIPILLARDENLVPELRYFNFSYQPMYDENKNIYSILVFGYEVTEHMIAKKRIEESEAYYRQMTNLMPAKIINMNSNGAVTYCNKNWLNYTGLSCEEFISVGFKNIIHPEEVEEFNQCFLQATETGTDLEMEMRFRNSDGEYKWHLSLASPVTDEEGKIKMWVGSATEIQKLKEEERLKNNFLSMASHELKTPLTTIKAYGQIASKMLRDKDDTVVLGLMTRMDKQINKLNNLLGDLLDFTKIKRGKLIYHETFFDFNEFVNEIIEDMQSASNSHTIKSRLGETAIVFGDKDKLGQALNNLISNAIKYSPNADSIFINSFKEEEEMKLTVTDFGIGILPNDEHKVFEEFYRVTGDDQTTYPGMGIGLFISSEILKHFRGRLWVESTGDTGSVFALSVPIDHREMSVKEL